MQVALPRGHSDAPEATPIGAQHENRHRSRRLLAHAAGLHRSARQREAFAATSAAAGLCRGSVTTNDAEPPGQDRRVHHLGVERSER